MPPSYSEWFQIPAVNIKRDVEVELVSLLFKYPTLAKILTLGAEPAKNHKHEWTEYEQQQLVGTLTADIAAHIAGASGITITVDDSSIFAVDDQVYVETLNPQYVITAIPNGTTLTVTEIRGFALAAPAGNGQTAKKITSVTEKSDYNSVPMSALELPHLNYNFTQIFRKNMEITQSMAASILAGSIYGYENINGLDALITQTLNYLAFDINDAVMYGLPVERVNTSVKGKMRGIMNFIDNAALYSGATPPDNVIIASGALTLNHLNDITAYISNFMQTTSQLMMVMSPQQARAMAPFQYNSSNAALRVNVDDGSTRDLTVGNSVDYFQPSTPNLDRIEITINRNMPRDQIWFLDPTMIRLIPLVTQEAKVMIQNQPGSTAINGFVTAEYTLVMKQPSYRSGMIKGLTVPTP